MGSQLKMGFSREQTFVRAQAKPLRPNPRQLQGHFDPEELTRRLYIVLADQKAHAERKRRRAEEAALAPKEPRSWNVRHLGRDAAAAERMPKVTTREKATCEAATSQPPRQTSARPAMSMSGGELKRQNPSKPSAQRKEPMAALAKDAPRSAPEPATATYRHVPQEAAKQFERTTTIGTMRDAYSSSSALVHKLSKEALEHHLAAAGAVVQPTSLRAAVIEEQPISLVEKLVQDRERVDQWRSNIPDEQVAAAPEEELEEEFYIAPQYQQHSFRAERARLMLPLPADQQHRRNSTGDIPGKAPEDRRLSMVLVGQPSLAEVLEAAAAAAPDDPMDALSAEKRRADWTQSDAQATAGGIVTTAEASIAANPAPQRHKPLLSPLLRKADSIWTLRGRLGSGGGRAQEKGDMPQIPESPKSPKSFKSSKSPKEPKGGFFAKFKR